MKIVITGGAGFIGANLARALLARPEVTDVVAVDDLSTGFEANLAGTAVELRTVVDPRCRRPGSRVRRRCFSSPPGGDSVGPPLDRRPPVLPPGERHGHRRGVAGGRTRWR